MILLPKKTEAASPALPWSIDTSSSRLHLLVPPSAPPLIPVQTSAPPVLHPQNPTSQPPPVGMAPAHSAATSAKRGARSRAPPNPSPAPPADGPNLVHQLLQAACDGDLRLLKRLVRALDEGRGRPREAVEAAKDDGIGALHVAARNGSLPVCRFLVEELGVDVDTVDDKGATPLAWATLAGSVDTVSYLLCHGVSLSKADYNGFTPLHYAARTSSPLPAREIFCFSAYLVLL